MAASANTKPRSSHGRDRPSICSSVGREIATPRVGQQALANSGDVGTDKEQNSNINSSAALLEGALVDSTNGPYGVNSITSSDFISRQPAAQSPEFSSSGGLINPGLHPLSLTGDNMDDIKQEEMNFTKASFHQKTRRPRFDLLRLREWFNQMDSSRSGHVDRRQWMDFMFANPQLCNIMVGTDGISCKDQQRDARAIELRKMRKVWTMIDTDKNGTLEWDEFVEFFRISGFLLEYCNKDNPKDKMAEVLRDLHEGIEDYGELRQFEEMKRKHLEGTRRRSCGAIEASTLGETMVSTASTFSQRNPRPATVGNGMEASDKVLRRHSAY